MKNLAVIFSLAVLLFVSSACERVIEPKELPQQDPRLVLNCILYSDTFITAYVSLSKSILSGKPYKTIDNAVCDLYENGSFISTLSGIGGGGYISTLKPQVGKTYQLKVSASGYDGVSASTQMPDTASIVSVERYDTTNYKISIENYGGGSSGTNYLHGSLKFKLRITDNPDIKNYYSLVPIIAVFDTSGKALTSIGSISSNTNDNSYGNSIELDDQTIVNGKEIPVDVTVYFSQNLDENFKLQNIVIVLRLDNLSSDYYKYLITFKKQVTTSASFFAEPTQVFSNVSNGMGIMAGVSQNFIQIYP